MLLFIRFYLFILRYISYIFRSELIPYNYWFRFEIQYSSRVRYSYSNYSLSPNFFRSLFLSLWFVSLWFVSVNDHIHSVFSFSWFTLISLFKSIIHFFFLIYSSAHPCLFIRSFWNHELSCVNLCFENCCANDVDEVIWISRWITVLEL